MYQNSIFLFTNDLRLNDNTTLNQAFLQSEIVFPLFIFNPEQVDANNPYRSMNAIQFMIESLFDLEEQIKKEGGKLTFWYGDPIVILKKIVKQQSIDAIFLNKDYTPFAQKRETEIQKLCHQLTIACNTYHDHLLTDPLAVIAKKGSFYKVFTSFFNRAVLFPVQKQNILKEKKCASNNIPGSENLIKISKMILDGYNNPDLFIYGGTKQGLKILKQIKTLASYQQTRDIPSLSTSGLAAHLNFGTISIRQAYHDIAKQLGSHHLLIKQLYWREFFIHSAFFYPQMFGHAMKSSCEHIQWKNSKKAFERWCTGTTGFPIVDAGMRQLNKIGWMHNRVRMIVASFLVKDLQIDWRWGERYFATQLVDYNPAVNNGNWQWAASTGFDSQPYFRIFNPWEQQKKFDPDCIYIKKWIPELKNESNKTIHAWFKNQQQSIYPSPMVDHKSKAMEAKQLFKKSKITN
jgi:deoxyribodipyrimidine photo-lyase